MPIGKYMDFPVISLTSMMSGRVQIFTSTTHIHAGLNYGSRGNSRVFSHGNLSKTRFLHLW